MRNIQTIIAHILWDDEEPEILRGSLRLATRDEVTNFSSQDELITLMHQMMRHPGVDHTPEAESNDHLTHSSTRLENN